MAGKKKSTGWAAVLKELKDPGDWAAACLGGAAGAGATLGFHGLDFGHCIPTGCLTAIGLKKTWVLSRRFDKSKARAKGLLKAMQSNSRDPKLIADLQYLLARVDAGGVTYEDFEKELKDIGNKDKGVAPLVLPAPAAAVAVLPPIPASVPLSASN